MKSVICLLAAVVWLAVNPGCDSGKEGSADGFEAVAAEDSVPAPPMPERIVTRSEIDFTTESYPVVDGSTSTEPMAYHIFCELLDLDCAWRHEFDGAKRFRPVDESLYIKHSGTHGAYVNLIEGGADLILVARAPSDDELELAAKRGVALDVVPVALDAFVFIVHNDNPVTSLTLEQVRGIYTGRIVDWAEVGGPPRPIVAYQRERNSGSQELMMSLVMKDLEMVGGPDLMELLSMMGPINRLRTDAHGICYTVYFFKEFMVSDGYETPPGHEPEFNGGERGIYNGFGSHGPAPRSIAINGVYATPETIGARRYPLVSEVYLAIRADEPEHGNAWLLRDFLLSPDGQELLAGSGYVAELGIGGEAAQ